MPPRNANVTSLEALQAFKGALHQFIVEASEALTALELEGRRPSDWIENDRGRYWPRQEQLASNQLAEARINLERCEVTTSADDRKFCYDERKAFEKAKLRLRTAEAKVQALKKWRVIVNKEVQEFIVQAAKLKRYLDTDLARGTAAMDRMLTALDRYTQFGAGPIDPQAGLIAQGPSDEASDPAEDAT